MHERRSSGRQTAALFPSHFTFASEVALRLRARLFESTASIESRYVLRRGRAPCEIESNRPLFSGRDGVKKYPLSEIEPERRNGYAWYGAWGEGVVARYEKWLRARPPVAPELTN